MVDIDYDTLEKMSKEFGDTYYLIDTAGFRKNYEDLLNAFKREYADTKIAYSYKTNYLPCLCRIIAEMGGYAEVVSDMEIYAARRVGVDYPDIYHNGPYKKKDAICELLLNGGHVNIDADYEVEFVKSIAKSYSDRKFEVGIRCSLDIGQEIPSRFGFDVYNGDLEKAVKVLEEEPNILVTGLHIHLPFRSLESFDKRMNALESVLDRKILDGLKYVSVGGGYMGRVDNRFATLFDFKPPTYDEYARTVAGRFSMMAQKNGISPSLIIEPGSALVADTMSLATRVVSIKKVRNRTVATLSGSTYNMNPSVKGVNRPVSVFNRNEDATYYEGVDFVGYTCIEGDILYSGYSGKLGVDDQVVFHNVGSYSIVMKPPFILPDIPIVEIGKNGCYRIIKRAQSGKDIFDIMYQGGC